MPFLHTVMASGYFPEFSEEQLFPQASNSQGTSEALGKSRYSRDNYDHKKPMEYFPSRQNTSSAGTTSTSWRNSTGVQGNTRGPRQTSSDSLTKSPGRGAADCISSNVPSRSTGSKTAVYVEDAAAIRLRIIQSSNSRNPDNLDRRQESRSWRHVNQDFFRRPGNKPAIQSRPTTEDSDDHDFPSSFTEDPGGISDGEDSVRWTSTSKTSKQSSKPSEYGEYSQDLGNISRVSRDFFRRPGPNSAAGASFEEPKYPSKEDDDLSRYAGSAEITERQESRSWRHASQDCFRRPGNKPAIQSRPTTEYSDDHDFPSSFTEDPGGISDGEESVRWASTSKTSKQSSKPSEYGEYSQDLGNISRNSRDFFRRPGPNSAAGASFEEPKYPSKEDDDLSRYAISAKVVEGKSSNDRGVVTASVPQLNEHHQSQSRHKTQHRTNTPSFTDQDLLKFLDEKPSVVLLELVRQKDKCLALLSADELNDNTLVLTVRVLSCMCYLDLVLEPLYTQDLNLVLSMMESHLFLSKHLTRYLVGLITRQEVDDFNDADEIQTLVSDVRLIVKLLHLFLENKSSGYTEVGVVLILLQKLVTSVAMVNEDFDPEGDIMTKVHRLTECCHSVEESRLQVTARQQIMKNPPPNNFREIPVFPECTELRQKTKPFLRKNIVEGRYGNVEHYLDVQFRLLREDFVAPLREGVTEFLSNPTSRPHDIRVYLNVFIEGQKMENGAFTHTLKFQTQGHRSERWESSKRFLYGSFVCLSRDNFKTISCATVENRDPANLQKGLVDVHFLTDPTRDPSGAASGPFVMAESAAYFEAYRHVLQTMQLVNEDNFAFKRYIVDVSSSVLPPVYLTVDDPIPYDLTPLLEGHDMPFKHDLKIQVVVDAAYLPILEENRWPSAADLHLDASQKAALQAALTKEFAIIQGPPGTGKTYIGLKIIELLLHNTPWNYSLLDDTVASPILVVCYTNHALDQFLEGIIAFGEENVVRVGSRSQSESLKTKNVSYLRKPKSRPRPSPMAFYLSEEQFVERKLQDEYGHIRSVLLELDLTKTHILHVMELKNCISPAHCKQLWQDVMTNSKQTNEDLPQNILMLWLTGDNGLTREVEDNQNQKGSQESEHNDCIEDDDEVDEMQQNPLSDDDRHYSSVGPRRDSHNLERGISSAKQHRVKVLNSTSQEELQKSDAMTKKEARRTSHVWSLTMCDRWRLYRMWIKKYQQRLDEELRQHRQKHETLKLEMRTIKTREDLDICRKAKVIGMTTTGAAKYRSMLEQLGPRIVVVEEAAEVLEAHIITSLTAKCQHLILIGDHKQLKPNPTVYRLAKLFNLDTSLFERMINNGVPYQSLTQQHRMRPEISQIMKRHFYEQLQDDDSVLNMDNIKGVLHPMFFINHQHLEDGLDDNRTRSNKFEAEFVVELCRYLLRQGYRPSQITVLTTYTGQMFCLKHLMEEHTFKGVRVCVVDSYQGEENDIILLSLVRSNEGGSIGFLRTSNRVCVAMSRARRGFYCIGNASVLKTSHIWRDIIGTLEDANTIGYALPLICQNHPSKITHVSTAQEFKKRAPGGGCDKLCEYRLKCNHVCGLSCHPHDPDHKENSCQRPCAKLCRRGEHLCPLLCYETRQACSRRVPKLMSDCGHEIQVLCSKFDDHIICNEPCPKIVDICGHRCPNKCGDNCPGSCFKKCGKNLSCGHACLELCGKPCSRYCEVQVKKALPKCGHDALVACYKDPGEVECETKVTKLRSICGHRVEISCFDEPNSVACNERCQNTLRCGHRCPNACGKPCEVPACLRNSGVNICREIVEKSYQSCDHSVKLPCHQDVSTVLCAHPCRKLLACGHHCPKKCGEACSREKLSGLLMSLQVDYGKTFLDFCTEKCDKSLPCGHPCPNKCGQPCTNETFLGASSLSFSTTCEEPVTKLLLCGHTVTKRCHQVLKLRSCSDICNKKLFCGHVCLERCGAPCRCSQDRALPGCKHVARLPCYQDIDSFVCAQKCQKRMKCGHKCFRKCGEPCPGEEGRSSESLCLHPSPQCRKYMRKTLPDCGHELRIRLRCNEAVESFICQENVEKVFSCGHSQIVGCCWASSIISCGVACDFVLDCGHKCTGHCGSCNQGNATQHSQCAGRTCKRILLCGHPCNRECQVPCPPDCMRCQSKPYQPHNCVDDLVRNICEHNLKCKWLKHNGCILPCPQKLSTCGHPCIGVCGEPCPPYCGVCKQWNDGQCRFTRSTSSLRKNVTYIYLADCDHLIQTRLLDRMVAGLTSLESGCVPIRSVLCPECKEPIRNCPRYDDVLEATKQSVEAVRRKYKEPRGNASSDHVGAGRGSDGRARARMSFAVGKWMRCARGHVFYQEEDYPQVEQLHQVPTCPECSQ